MNADKRRSLRFLSAFVGGYVLQPESRDAIHLPERLAVFFFRRRFHSRFQRPQHVVLCASLHRQQKWESEAGSIRRVHSKELLEFALCQAVQTRACLLLRGRRAQARSRTQIRMRLQQSQPLGGRGALHFSDHRGMQCFDRGERPRLPCAFRHPRRLFEDPAEGFDKGCALQQIQLMDEQWHPLRALRARSPRRRE